MFKKIMQNKLLKSDPNYISNQIELDSYKEMGIERYEYLGSGCEICQKLNGQVFLVSEAEVGVNFPPMHLKCKCSIIAKPKIDLFKDRNGVNPLNDNPKFEEWKKKYQNSN